MVYKLSSKVRYLPNQSSNKMMKPSLPKGTRDFSAPEIAKRTYITSIIKKHFELFGFQPIETPSFENSETLMGKYGEEGDRLIFKILNSGDYFEKLKAQPIETLSSKSVTPQISEKALRYDLTVPFARYVVQHQNELEFPFKRYQIQPVWRADRPQKGRFREFYQCDADVVGSKSLWHEVELVLLYDAVFTELGLKGVTIKINNRKILAGIAQVIGVENQIVDFTVALDKLDKIGKEGVSSELLAKGFSETALKKAEVLYDFSGTIHQKIAKLKRLLADSEQGKKGIVELEFICDNLMKLGLQTVSLDVDVTLARGLNYYTGAIFEVVAPKSVAIGSIGGGGRYDDLTGIFGLKDTSGVGISFGLDRIYLVLEELQLFPDRLIETTQVLFLNHGQEAAFEAFSWVQQLRKMQIKAEVYSDEVKIDKQFKHAEKRNILFVVKQIKNAVFVVKNLPSGVQVEVDFEGLVELIGRNKKTSKK